MLKGAFVATYLTAETIKSLREARGLTQGALAAAVGVTDKAVSKWETGRGLPDIALVELLAQARCCGAVSQGHVGRHLCVLQPAWSVSHTYTASRVRRACRAGVSAHRLAPFGYCFELTDKAIAPGTGLKAFDYCFELT